MKRCLKALSLVLMAAFVCLLSACSLGGYSVTFIDYKGTVVGEKTYSNSESVTNANSPVPAAREGYTFVRWETVDEESAEEYDFSTDVIMQAAYQINVTDSIFSESGRKAEWFGSTTSISTTFSAGQTKSILIRDRVSFGNFSTVTILPASESDFSLLEMNIYDKDGKWVSPNSPLFGTWQPSAFETNGEYDFVIEITAAYAGVATITIS